VSVDVARQAAYDVLAAVRVEDSYANLVLPPVLAQYGLSGRDAGFVTELAAGTLRLQGTYDAVIDSLVDRALDPPVRDVLRLGAHQLLSMRVPTHAAVTTSVDLARSNVGHKVAGFVNAVLRKVARRDLDDWIAVVAPSAETDAVGHESIARSHPRWVVEKLGAALGGRSEELDQLLAADNVAPRVMLVARPGRCEVSELVAAGGRATGVSPYAVELEGGDPGQVPAVRDGRAAVQDEGSQLVAVALTRAPIEGDDARWLDVCAGPGGKAALLARLAASRGAGVLSAEKQPHRAELVRRALGADEPGSLGVVVADGTAPPWEQGSFDRVLVDAPCSGLGALRRRPESRWRKSEDDIAGLVELQIGLLRSAIRSVREGGVVAYVTCTPVLEETAGVIAEILATEPVRIVPAADLLPEVTDAEGPMPGTLQLWPHRHQTDAMFLAVLVRV
jgi:16S rRNA (cytosine967-C5)-methyltransferase